MKNAFEYVHECCHIQRQRYNQKVEKCLFNGYFFAYFVVILLNC